jgi:hypothetical protein
LDSLCRKIDTLDPKIIDGIGSRAKELMKEVDYDKNKIDFLVRLSMV